MIARRLILILIMAAVACVLVPPASADGLDIVDAYNINGVLAVPGADACAGLTCVEALSFSFTLGIEEQSGGDGPEFWYYVLPDPISVQSVGPLGQFSLSPGEDVNGAGNYLPLLNQYQSEIDIDFRSGGDMSEPMPPKVGDGDIFFCNDPVCRQDFPPTLIIPGEAEATVTYAPEPSTLLLLSCGVFGLAVLSFSRKRSLRFS